MCVFAWWVVGEKRNLQLGFPITVIKTKLLTYHSIMFTEFIFYSRFHKTNSLLISLDKRYTKCCRMIHSAAYFFHHGTNCNLKTSQNFSVFKLFCHTFYTSISLLWRRNSELFWILYLFRSVGIVKIILSPCMSWRWLFNYAVHISDCPVNWYDDSERMWKCLWSNKVLTHHPRVKTRKTLQSG